MSIAALLQAARDQLQQTMTFPGGPGRAPMYVEIQPEGRPPFDCGEWYVGLDENHVDSEDKAFLREVYYIDVYISIRTGWFAPDQRGSSYLQKLYGMDVLERQVLTSLHANQTVRNNANTNYLLIDPPSVLQGDAFNWPLYYIMGRQRNQMKDGVEWTGSEKSKDTFLVRTLPFVGGLRIQSLDIMK